MALSFIGAAQAATGAPAPGGSFPPFDASTFAGQLFWLAVTFGATYWLMANIAIPRVSGIIADRRAKIAADLQLAADAQKSAEDASKAFDAELNTAKANAQGIAQTARDAANKQSDARRHQVEADLSAKLQSAEASIATTKAKAMTNVEGIARDAVAAIVERLSGAAPQGGAVDAALAALAKK